MKESVGGARPADTSAAADAVVSDGHAAEEAADEAADEAGAGAGPGAGVTVLVEEDLLLEEVSVDGMCGVY